MQTGAHLRQQPIARGARDTCGARNNRAKARGTGRFGAQGTDREPGVAAPE